ncbi:retrotransposon polyprotein [Cucumis melo var. makuwa]|uniref:Retrotransposon polyprotein n=1 Tax=Cucumis melo var. makuwa TaxID=1194695 RepID=A0A5A7TEH7_CUCMM|nr:retrotransposon polyprotein [Cucumis melo var. makuwa]TYK05344.1 retrotransposon polyprotein [Cucumis melo var. makuwa]
MKKLLEMQYYEIESEDDYDEEPRVKDLGMVLQNKAADALSRIEERLELNSMATHGLIDMEVVGKEVEKYEELQKIIKILKENPEEKGRYQWENERGPFEFSKDLQKDGHKTRWGIATSSNSGENLRGLDHDFIEGLPLAGGVNVIMVVID